MPIKFGKQLRIQTDGELTTIKEDVFTNYKTLTSVTMCIESVRVNDDKDILAEILKLLDRYKNNEVDLPGVQLFRDRKTGQLRLEKSWSVPDLH